MQNILVNTSDTSVSKTLKFPIGERPTYHIRLKPMSFQSWCLVRTTEISSITQEVAESIAEENSSQYYTTNPYELNRDLKDTITALGGQVID